MTTLSTDQEEASRLATDFIHDVVRKATYLHNLFWERGKVGLPLGHYLGCMYEELDISDLLALLRADEEGVVSWINQLPETISLLKAESCKVICVEILWRSTQLHCLKVVYKDDKPTTF